MMKKTVLFFSFLYVLFYSAQNPLLLNKNWQIEQLTIAGNPINIPADPDAFYIDFNNISSSFSFKTKVCSSIFGAVTYHSNNYEFTITNFNTQNENCNNPDLTNFQTSYFSFFTNFSGTANKFVYDFTYTNTGVLKLYLTNSSGNSAIFKYVKTPEEISSKIWKIQSLTLNGIQVDKPTYFPGGNTTFMNGTFSTSYFNTSSGEMGNLSNQYFKIISIATTLAQSEDGQIDDFDNKYHSFLRQNSTAGYDNNYFNYALLNSGETLKITNKTGDFALYNKSQLKVIEGHQLSFRIYPNPTKDMIKIVGREKMNSILITDFSGKVVMKKTLNNESEISLSIQNFPPGIYLITLNNKVTYRIIKE